MKTFLLVTLTTVFTTSGLLACTAVTTETIPPVSASGLMPTKRTMKPFDSEAELARYFEALAEKQRAARGRSSGNLVYDSQPAPQATAAAPTAKAEAESVTNVQHAGVDEGGIVKVHG